MGNIKVLAISGLSECGKSTVGRQFRELGFSKLKIVDFFKSAHKKLGIQQPFADWAFAADESDNDDIFDLFYSEFHSYLVDNNIKFATIESLYGPRLALYLKKRMGDDFSVAFVDVDFETRVVRQQGREGFASAEEARAFLIPRDEQKVAKGVLRVKSLAEHVIDNNGSQDELMQQLKNLAQQIKGSN